MQTKLQQADVAMSPIKSEVLTEDQFRINEVSPGSALLVGNVAVFNAAGSLCATQAKCTHKQGLLSEGKLDGSTVTCPWHGSQFNVRTGAVLRGPAADPLQTYRVIVEGEGGEMGRVEAVQLQRTMSAHSEGGKTMNVQDIMTNDVQWCAPDTNLASAAKLMWDTDCGVLPVLNAEGRVLGMITDRDICMSCATKNRAPSELTVWDTVSGKTYTCKMSDDVHTVMDIMKREQVRRLPVVDEEGVLQGLISMNDCILLAGETNAGKAPAISSEDVARALKAISAHRILVGTR